MQCNNYVQTSLVIALTPCHLLEFRFSFIFSRTYSIVDLRTDVMSSPLSFKRWHYSTIPSRFLIHTIKAVYSKTQCGNLGIFLPLRFSVKSISCSQKLPFSQCGNYRSFLSLRFYVKSIFGILEVQNLPF